MFDENRVICIATCYNELNKIDKVAAKMDKKVVDEFLIIDDGSTDGSPETAKPYGATIITLNRNMGVGHGIRVGINYAIKNNYDIIVFIAGNNKDNPKEIIKLLKPITREGYDFIQGSRFLKGGKYDKMPFYRNLATRLHPILFSLVARKWVSESTNGFRAFKTSILKEKSINLWQPWLDKYELEPYLYYKVIKLGYKTKEVPVSKIYPSKKIGYSKMNPITGWWSIFRPLFLLGLHLRK
ncbi:MAG: glycosyltransferase family 2 protein [Candidatus Thorarchaeota archaeon]